MDATTIITQIATKAASASRTLSTSSREERDFVLTKIADNLEKNCDLILKANQIDMENAKSAGISQALLDRLLLTKQRVMDMAKGARDIAKLKDPLGQILIERNLANGLNLKQISVPFGVVGMVYEARPNVTVDAAVILIKSGNAALLRGSATAAQSNKVLVDVIREAFTGSKISQEVVQLIPSEDRSTVQAMLTAKGLVDLV
ncbi:MAG: aldehyde dehydrogenase family protein, partial [Candidatus Nanopelagicus sp.]